LVEAEAAQKALEECARQGRAQTVLGISLCCALFRKFPQFLTPPLQIPWVSRSGKAILAM
jgi:hypothetical protein